MTPTAFRSRLAVLGLSLRQFAAATGHDETTCANWGKSRSERAVQSFPAWVGLLLREWEAHGVPEDVERT